MLGGGSDERKDASTTIWQHLLRRGQDGASEQVVRTTLCKLTHPASSRIHSIRLRGAHPSRRAGAATAVGDLRHS